MNILTNNYTPSTQLIVGQYAGAILLIHARAANQSSRPAVAVAGRPLRVVAAGGEAASTRLNPSHAATAEPPARVHICQNK